MSALILPDDFSIQSKHPPSVAAYEAFEHPPIITNSDASVVTTASDNWDSTTEQPENEQSQLEAELLKETSSPLSELMVKHIHHDINVLPPVRPTNINIVCKN